MLLNNTLNNLGGGLVVEHRALELKFGSLSPEVYHCIVSLDKRLFSTLILCLSTSVYKWVW